MRSTARKLDRAGMAIAKYYAKKEKEIIHGNKAKPPKALICPQCSTRVFKDNQGVYYCPKCHWDPNTATRPKTKGPLGDECPECEYREIHYDYDTHLYHCARCGWDSETKDGAAVPSPAETKETK